MFLGLPFPGIEETGTFIPILKNYCKKGFEELKSPEEIISEFFEHNTDYKTLKEKNDFLFRVIQYIERQIVLFDAVEEASFKEVNSLSNNLNVLDIIQKDKDEKERESAIEKLNDFSVRLVFTAHPTQFYPLTVLDIINGLRKAVQKDDIEKIDLQLQQLGFTSFLQKKKPTPFQEAQNIIYYLRNVYYHAMGSYYETLKNALPSDEFSNPNILRIGFWPGGDRDGNPFVTAETTKNVATELRNTLMKSYYGDVKKLEKLLSFEHTYPIIKELRLKLYHSIFETQKSIPYEEILGDLQHIQTYLDKYYNGLYINEVKNLEHKVHIFKNHFATLDIRQNHEVHVRMINQILQSAGLIQESYTELSDEELDKALFQRDWTRDTIQFEDDEHQVLAETYKNMAQLGELQELGGEKACNRYIISNSEDKYAVLFVLALFRINGYDLDTQKMNIVPLFETMAGMQNSQNIMSDLYEHPVYQKHIKKMGQRQTIMLGFSDGTKDGGYLKANWSIFRTKEILSQLSEEKGIRVLFFDGRGGPPARGGGKTQRFYASLSDKIANNDIELTIQGQTITSTYGTAPQFLNNCDQMLTAGLRNHLATDEERSISEEHRALIQELSELSFSKYEDLKHHPQFIPYLEHRSTLKYYSKANIGSRPGKRGKSKELTLNDLRAISFVGAWSQLKQNVPGYYGIGSALHTIKEQNGIEVLQNLWRSVPFFRALLKNSMMSLEKSDFRLTNYMSEDAEFKEFWNLLYQEYQLTKMLLLEVSNYSELMEEEPISKASIQKREEIVLPLLTIQQYALQGVLQNDENKQVYEKLVIRSLYGNINASRNSA